MKWKLFVCGMALIVAGCASNNGPYAELDEFGFTYDVSSRPFPARSPEEMGRDYAAPVGPVVTGSEITMDPAPYFINVTAYQ